MAEVRAAVEAASRVPFTVLVEGESGSGKELVAREIHRLGPRRDAVVLRRQLRGPHRRLV